MKTGFFLEEEKERKEEEKAEKSGTFFFHCMPMLVQKCFSAPGLNAEKMNTKLSREHPLSFCYLFLFFSISSFFFLTDKSTSLPSAAFCCLSRLRRHCQGKQCPSAKERKQRESKELSGESNEDRVENSWGAEERRTERRTDGARETSEILAVASLSKKKTRTSFSPRSLVFRVVFRISTASTI